MRTGVGRICLIPHDDKDTVGQSIREAGHCRKSEVGSLQTLDALTLARDRQPRQSILLDQCE